MDRVIDPTSLSRNEAYIEALDELWDVPGLSKIKSVMDKYKLSFVALDFKLRFTVRGCGVKTSSSQKRKNLNIKAVEQLSCVRGVDQAKLIMYKYNISFFLINRDFHFSAKRSKNYCPLRH